MTDEQPKDAREKLLLTYDELAKATSLCRAYLFKLKKQGMPYIQIGRRVRFDGEEVVAWFKKRSRAERRAAR